MKNMTKPTRITMSRVSILGLLFCLSLTFCGGDDKKPPPAPPDADGDGIVDANDNCPNGTTGMATTADDTSPTADPDGDGCKNSEDIDDDNDGLVEIATAAELNNMRHDLTGKSYDDEADSNEGSTTGAPTSPTTLCPEETSADSGVYLCGYELVADITLPAAGEAGDLNGETAGNFDPIGNNTDGHFTAYLEGNGRTIQGLHIDITGVTAGDNDANDAALIAFCRGSIHNLILGNPRVLGRRRVAVLCATMNGASVRNVRVLNASTMQNDSSVTFNVYAGSLAGEVARSSISNSYATGNVTASTSGRVVYFGGLVGNLGSSSISNSYATGNVTASTSGNDSVYFGGLAGFMGSSSISNSYATGDVTASTSGRVVYFGGLVGRMVSNNISNSYATGNITVSSNSSILAGGLAGSLGMSNIISNSYATGDVTASGGSGVGHSGGLAGFMINSNISNSYATGDVSASGSNVNSGGLLGSSSSANISNSYYNSEATQTVNSIARSDADKRGVGSVGVRPCGGERANPECDPDA